VVGFIPYYWNFSFDKVAYKNVVSNGLVLDKNGQKMSKRLGNAADPFETAEYGPDATRWYMISMQILG
jgi:isoleucyl-tRNA synthetase